MDPRSREDRDPEIAKLSSEIHILTGRINMLVVEINKTTVLLEERANKQQLEGEE